MSEAPKPKRTRAKAAVASVAIDSKATPSIEPETRNTTQWAEPGDSGPDSNVTTQAEQPEPAVQATQAATQTTQHDAGNVPDATAASNGDSPAARVRYHEVRERLMKHAEWGQIIGTVKEMRLDPKLAKMRTEYRERFIWGEMDRLYPPILIDPKAQPVALLKTDSPQVEAGNELRKNSETPPVREGGVKGLGEIPPGWPPLPANAVLSIELGWVQANRLYVVEDLASGGTRVHLDRAHEPAPSRAAIGWLETSIRSYAKYVEVAAKVTGSGDEDNEQVKRERLAIEEIRELLREMAGNPPGPGR